MTQVTIYTTPVCGYCTMAKRLLAGKGVAVTEIDAGSDPQALQQMMARSGRRTASLLYCLTYGLSCVTKHWNSYRVLMLGRILGGIATSLLFTAFESWLVSEHNKARAAPRTAPHAAPALRRCRC